MKSDLRIIPVLIFVIVNTLPALGQQSRICISITNIRSEKGLIRLALYNHEDQFPDEPVRPLNFTKDLAANGSMQVVIDSIQPGTYAISLLDDEDGNDKMNFNLLRMPKEGYGFSNNVKPGLKCPPFERCSFPVGGDVTRLEIKIQYFRE